METATQAALHETAPLVSPRALTIELPPGSGSWDTVVNGRSTIRRILSRKDRRLLAVVGPCSIHDPQSALEYAQHLARLREELEDRIYIIMRVYFEKPRTAVGWKGLINDPSMNGSCDMATGLRIARKLLLSITELGLPAGMELLDPIVSHYVGDLASWAAIGARTTESQVHRQMASGLAMPVGIKNNTEGCLQSAVDAITAARAPHTFLSLDRHGRVCVARTSGNTGAHLVLRGGKQGPNYDSATADKARDLLHRHSLPLTLVVDCSHMNSRKSHENQSRVWKEVVARRAAGEDSIVGVMTESNLVAGRQNIPRDRSSLRYGQSVTDACIGWEETESLLRETYEMLGT